MSDHELRKALDPIADIVGGTGIEASFRLPDCQFVGLKKRAALPCLKVTQHGRDGGRRVSCRKDFKGALLTPNEIPVASCHRAPPRFQPRRMVKWYQEIRTAQARRSV